MPESCLTISVIPANGLVEKVVARSARRDEAISKCVINNDWRLLRFARNDTVGTFSTVPNAGIQLDKLNSVDQDRLPPDIS